jgi:hypothetical protein
VDVGVDEAGEGVETRGVDFFSGGGADGGGEVGDALVFDGDVEVGDAVGGDDFGVADDEVEGHGRVFWLADGHSYSPRARVLAHATRGYQLPR